MSGRIHHTCALMIRANKRTKVFFFLFFLFSFSNPVGEVYTGTLTAEFNHITSRHKKDWLMGQLERKTGRQSVGCGCESRARFDP